MKAERWQRVDQLLQAALERDAGEHGSFLDQACAGDEDLRREVESLLAVNMPTNDFLSKPAFEVAAGMISATLPDKKDGLPLEPGAVLDNRYQIERELGRGGMGVVFLARDLKLHDKQVVIKVLLEKHLNPSDPDKQSIGLWLKQKFRDEIKALALIDDPGVVKALDVGELPEGQAYLVMEYVPGKPLRKEISPTGMELRRAAGLIDQIAQALAAAHEKGIIHRDLKPENILLLEVRGEEQTRLIDFGIATVRDALTAALPHTTHVAGTGAYMAPEQLRGKPEAASDIYALGVIAYEMVTGRRPFNAASLTQLSELQRDGIKFKPREWRSDLPAAAETVILKALAFQPADRYLDAREFGNLFRQAIEVVDPFQTSIGVLPQEESPFHPDAPPTQRLPSRQRFLIPVAALLAVMLAGTFAWRNIRHADNGVATVTSGNAATAPTGASPVTPERMLSYALSFKNSQRQVESGSDEPIFKARDEARLDLSSPQAGHLYVLNEGPVQTRGLPDFTLLFPTPRTNGGLSAVGAGQVIPVGLYFDQQMGVEKLWLIWSERPVPALEAGQRHINQREEGAITDRAEVAAIKQFLDAHPPVTGERDAANQLRKFKQPGEVLVGLMQLKHY